MGILWTITVAWCALILTPVAGQLLLYWMAVMAALFLMPLGELIRSTGVSVYILLATPILIVTALVFLGVRARTPRDQRPARYWQVAAMAVLALAATLTAGALNARLGQVQ